MIRYNPTSQMTIEGFESPFHQKLSPENRWVKLAALIPWDELASVYARNLQDTKGRLSIDIRLVVGALIVKHKLNLSDRETVDMIAENIYIQYFCGLKSFQTQKPFDASLFVDIRKRMGPEVFDRFNDLVIERSEQIITPGKRIMQKKQEDSDNDEKPRTGKRQAPSGNSETKDKTLNETPSNKGKLKIDATVADQFIQYPTDFGLLNRCREESERIIDALHGLNGVDKKPRTYRRKARKAYLTLAKKRRKTKKEIRKGIGQQLRFLRRNLGSIEKQLDSFFDDVFPVEFRAIEAPCKNLAHDHEGEPKGIIPNT